MVGKHPIAPAGLPNIFYGHSLKSLLTVQIKNMDFSIGAHPLDCSSSKADPYLRWKRMLDVLLILLALPFLIPLALFIALLIRSVSTGPVLFKQERVGHQGRRFMCFKFRTMFVDADTNLHQGHLHQLMNSNTPMLKMDAKGDPRIIPFGVLLRASGLDELPQLINVLRGEMSLVGPRPCLPYEYDKYLPWQRERFETMPGLTGLWQVSGKNKTTFVEMIQLDIRYAKNKTLGWDLKIILMTIPALVIQMLETRQARRASSRPVRRTAGYSNCTAQPYSFAKTALAGAVQARDCEDAWIRNETKLNL
jgi:lipopolysaccharide/colanic/teichoic acid biosynthesis glycosyltransferase